MAQTEPEQEPVFQRIDIDSGGWGADTIIKIDGKPYPYMTSLKYEIDAEGFAVLTITATGVPAHITGLAEVRSEEAPCG